MSIKLILTFIISITLAPWCLFGLTYEEKANLSNKKISTTLLMRTTANLLKNDNEIGYTNLLSVLSMSYSFKSGQVLSVSSGVTQKLNREKKVYLLNTDVSVNLNSFDVKGIDTTPFFGVVIPTSVVENEIDSYQGGFVVGSTYDLNLRYLLMQLSSQMDYNLYKYTISSLGAINNEWAGTLSLTMAKKFFNNKLSLYAFNSYVLIKNYAGTYIERFGLSQKISYQLNSQIRASLAHQNSGDVLKPNGQSNNIRFFNNNSSRLYAEININF